MMEFVIEHAWQFWVFVGLMVCAALGWFAVTYYLIGLYIKRGRNR
jgi:hypothetical protein